MHRAGGTDKAYGLMLLSKSHFFDLANRTDYASSGYTSICCHPHHGTNTARLAPNVPRKTAEGGSSTWVPATSVEDEVGTSGS